MSIKPLISVFVPIYNTEKYPDKCIDSIINQSYTNLEIILVDDSSPDNCGKVCNQYALKDSRIKVIHKSNGGLSNARNAGLDVATGEYIAFVDSDDIIHPQFIEGLLGSLLENNSTISFCNYIRFKTKSKLNLYNRNTLIKANYTFSGKEFINLTYNNQWTPKNIIICNKIYH